MNSYMSCKIILLVKPFSTAFEIANEKFHTEMGSKVDC